MKALCALVFICTLSFAASAQTADEMIAAGYLNDVDFVGETVAQSTTTAQSTSEPITDALPEDHSSASLHAPTIVDGDIDDLGLIEEASVPETVPAQNAGIELAIDGDLLLGHQDSFENLVDHDAASTATAEALEPGEEKQTGEAAIAFVVGEWSDE
jgi:hypothetical protein